MLPHKNVLVVYTIPRANEQKLSIDSVKNILKEQGIDFTLANRDELSTQQFLGRDLIIAVGGDGTFLRAAQFIDKQLIFGLNADSNNKEGFFMGCTRKDFAEKLKKIINRKFRVRKLPRLEAYINKKRIGTLALNEFFIGPRKSYHASKYVIKVRKIKERHKSSGVIVSTPSGSYAWTKACHGKKMPLNSKDFQFVIREPYEGKVFKNYKLKQSILKSNESITIISEMLDGILVADSVSKEFSLKEHDEVRIRKSNNFLKAIWLK